MSFLFSRGQTPEKRLRAERRDVERIKRDLENQMRKIDGELAKDRRLVKTALQKQQIKEAQFRTRHMLQIQDQKDHLYALKNEVSVFSESLSNADANIRLGECMRKITLAIQKANRMISPHHAQYISAQFELSRDMLAEKQEILSETFQGISDGSESLFSDGESIDARQANLLREIAEENSLSILERTPQPAARGSRIPIFEAPEQPQIIRTPVAFFGDATETAARPSPSSETSSTKENQDEELNLRILLLKPPSGLPPAEDER